MRRGRIFIFLILIVVMGLALLYFAYTQFGGGIVAQPTQAALTEVYYAAQNIPQGTTITQEMLGTFSIPPENVAEVMFTRGEEGALVGQSARFTLDQGVILTSSMVQSVALTAPDASLEAGFKDVDKQYQQYLKGNIAYSAPKTMKKNEQVTVDLVLDLSASQQALATQVITLSGLATSTAEPGSLVTGQGSPVDVTTNEIKVTDRMKAVLISGDKETVAVQRLHDNDIQLLGTTESTQWHWLVSAKKEGSTELVLDIYRLVQYQGEDHWREVDSYRSTIKVQVTTLQKLQTEFKEMNALGIVGWIFSTLITSLFIPLYLERRKAKRQQAASRPAGKYAPLKAYFVERSASLSEITVTFDDIEGIIHSRLPRSANHAKWWNNESSDVQARAWREAGWRMEQVDIPGRRVSFKKSPPAA